MGEFVRPYLLKIRATFWNGGKSGKRKGLSGVKTMKSFILQRQANKKGEGGLRGANRKKMQENKETNE